MIIKIDFYQKIDRSEIRKAVLSAYDLLGDKEMGEIFRDDYEMVCKPKGQLILEVSDDTDSWTKCFVWQDEHWHEVED